MTHQPICNEFVPLSKSIANRLMILSLRDNDKSYLDFLQNYQGILPDDIIICKKAIENWESNDWVDVGESRTSLIFLKEFARVRNLDKIWNLRGTLKTRILENTSQIVSAKLLCGEEIESRPDEPYHVKLTRIIINKWNKGEGKSFFGHTDDTLWEQCIAMESIILLGTSSFKIKSAEDVCLGYFLSLSNKMRKEDQITLEQIVDRFPTTINHESNRPIELLKTLIQIKTGKMISSRDHRIVMAASFFGLINNINLKFLHPECVSKSFPLWWKYFDKLKHHTGL